MQFGFIRISCDAPNTGRSIPSSINLTVFDLSCTNVVGGKWKYGDWKLLMGFRGEKLLNSKWLNINGGQ
jgi:hypothetical protein